MEWVFFFLGLFFSFCVVCCIFLFLPSFKQAKMFSQCAAETLHFQEKKKDR